MVSLIEEARPDLAIPAISGALRAAPRATRPILLTALEEALDRQAVTELWSEMRSTA